jgi:hypothetical protein
LLRSRAGDFIARDFKEVAELEELERREKEELDRLAKERAETDRKRDYEDKAAQAANEHSGVASNKESTVLAATSEYPTLSQMIASAPDFHPNDWAGVDFDAFFVPDPRGSFSPSGNTVQPAGGSPSGS